MTDDPRVKIAVAWCFNLVPALRFLAELDAVDPLRQPVSGDRVEAAEALRRIRRELTLVGKPGKAPSEIPDDELLMLSMGWIRKLQALAAADRVQAPAEKPDFPPWSREMAELVRTMSEMLAWLAHKNGSVGFRSENTTMTISGADAANRLTSEQAAAFPETKDAG